VRDRRAGRGRADSTAGGWVAVAPCTGKLNVNVTVSAVVVTLIAPPMLSANRRR
jgi:hypothetical protein